METVLSIGRFALVIIAVVSIASQLFSERKRLEFIWRIWKRFRIGQLLEVIAVISSVIVVGLLLMKIPFLSYGWTSLFYGHGGGNLLVGPIMEGSESSNGLIRILVPIFFFAFILAAPFLAKEEEDIFRKGHTEWGSIAIQSVKFGLVHCIMGVPLAFGFALIISGFFFGYKYKCAFKRNLERLDFHEAEKEAVMVTTTYHTMYNTILLLFLLVVTIASI